MMFNSHKKYIILLLCLIIFLPLAIQGQENFTNYRGNQQLTGYFNTDIPDKVSMLWTFSTEDEIRSSPVVEGNRIVIGSADGNVYCLDLNGKQIWKYKVSNAIEATALIYNHNVYVGDLSGNLYSLRLSDGKLNWRYQTDGQISGAPNWWSNGSKTYILVGSYDYMLHCVDINTGSAIWTSETNNYINGTVSIDGDEAIFGGCDGLLHVIDITTGKVKMELEIASYIAGSASLENGKAYMGDYDGYFGRVDYRQGKVDWIWSNEASQVSFIASPSINQDKVIIGNRDRYVYCLDKNTGKLIWKRNTGRQVEASAVLTSSEVLVANMSGVLMLLNAGNGSVKWSYEIGSAVFSNPAVVQGKIIFGAQDGKVYCLGN